MILIKRETFLLKFILIIFLFFQTALASTCLTSWQNILSRGIDSLSISNVKKLKEEYIISVSETGSGTPLADELHSIPLEQRPEVRAISTYDRMASDRHYGGALVVDSERDPHITKVQSLRMAKSEFERLPKNISKKRLSLANTIRTGRNQTGYGWVSAIIETPDRGHRSFSFYVELEGSKGQQRKQLQILQRNLIEVLLQYEKQRIDLNQLQQLYRNIDLGKLNIRDIYLNDEQVPLDKMIDFIIKQERPHYLVISPQNKLVSLRNLPEEPREEFKENLFSDNILRRQFYEYSNSETNLKNQWQVFTKDKNLNFLRRYISLFSQARPDTLKLRRSKLQELDSLNLSSMQKKAHLINLTSMLKGTIIEVGQGKSAASEIYKAPFSGTIFESYRFNKLGSMARVNKEEVNERLINSTIERIFNEVHIEYNFLRKFALIRNFNKKTKRGEIYFKFQPSPGKPASFLHIIFKGGLLSDDELSHLSLNLLLNSKQISDLPKTKILSILQKDISTNLSDIIQSIKHQ